MARLITMDVQVHLTTEKIRSARRCVQCGILALFVLIGLLAMDAHAQGVVLFANKPLPRPPERRVYDVDMTTLINGTNFLAQLLYQNNAGEWIAHPTSASFFPAGTLPGFWAGGNRTLVSAGGPDGMGGSIDVIMRVRVWDGGANSVSFEQAVAEGMKWGISLPFVYTEEFDPEPPYDNNLMKNFQGFALGGCSGNLRITQPLSGTILRAPASITLEAESSGTLGAITNVSYSLGETAVGSATAPPFTVVITNVPSGDFSIQAHGRSDAGETCDSELVFVRVMDPPIVTVMPEKQNSLVGSNVSFTALTRGSSPISYQWYGERQLLPGATDQTLLLTNVNEHTSGFYYVVASNAIGVSTSAAVRLDVRPILVLIDGNVMHTGVYTSSAPVTVELITSYPRGSIFYTLDESRPDFASTRYTGPFTLNRRVFLRAIAYSADFYEWSEAEPVHILLPPLHFLSATTRGGGNILIDPAGGAYPRGQTVRLTAQPEQGWTFLEWRGDVSGTNPVVLLQMTRDKCVEAIFATTLTTTAAGDGRIVLDPPGGLYPYGTLVRLYAVPATDNYFVLWGNYASGSENPLSFYIDIAQPQISSAFYPLGTNQVTLTVLPDGLGTIEISPRTNRYARGQTVQITATPAEEQQFLGWSGDLMNSQNPTSITLDSSKFITAHFSKRPRFLSGGCNSKFGEQGFSGTLQGAWATPYHILFSDNLADWNVLTTTTNRFGTTQFNDSTATNSAARFYRAELAAPIP